MICKRVSWFNRYETQINNLGPHVYYLKKLGWCQKAYALMGTNKIIEMGKFLQFFPDHM